MVTQAIRMSQPRECVPGSDFADAHIGARCAMLIRYGYEMTFEVVAGDTDDLPADDPQ